MWPHEALSFTPWLLDNVDVLSDLLGMDLVLEEAEHPVGGFSLDLKGYDEATGATVIVENQLEVSDHTHLGQIITYAAGTHPTTIVWVAAGFRPEHRAAIDWLNQRTDENTRFFGVAIHVVQIGDSAPAPNFELVAQPNDWEKEVKSATRARSDSGKPYREFWETFLQRIRAKRPSWTRARTSGSSWINMPTGVGGAAYLCSWTREGLVSQLYFDSRDADLNLARFESLQLRLTQFEEALGEPATWDPMDGRKGARIYLQSSFLDVGDRDQWPEIFDWMLDAQDRLRTAIAAAGGITPGPRDT